MELQPRPAGWVSAEMINSLLRSIFIRYKLFIITSNYKFIIIINPISQNIRETSTHNNFSFNLFSSVIIFLLPKHPSFLHSHFNLQTS